MSFRRRPSQRQLPSRSNSTSQSHLPSSFGHSPLRAFHCYPSRNATHSVCLSVSHSTKNKERVGEKEKFPLGYIHSVDQSGQRIHPFGIGPGRICPFGICPRSGNTLNTRPRFFCVFKIPICVNHKLFSVLF